MVKCAKRKSDPGIIALKKVLKQNSVHDQKSLLEELIPVLLWNDDSGAGYQVFGLEFRYC
jgi:hypothetical protein